VHAARREESVEVHTRAVEMRYDMSAMARGMFGSRYGAKKTEQAVNPASAARARQKKRGALLRVLCRYAV